MRSGNLVSDYQAAQISFAERIWSQKLSRTEGLDAELVIVIADEVIICPPNLYK